MSLIEGLIDIGKGIWSVTKGAAKAAFGFLKMMLFGAIMIIIGIYAAAKAMLDYAKRKWKDLKSKRPSAKPKEVGSATLKVLGNTLNQIEKEISNNTIPFSELEKEEVKKDVQEIKGMINRGEANGMHWIEGTNEDGEIEILDAELYKAETLSEDDKRRDDKGAAFIQKFS